jgi:hypothetical protein
MESALTVWSQPPTSSLTPEERLAETPRTQLNEKYDPDLERHPNDLQQDHSAKTREACPWKTYQRSTNQTSRPTGRATGVWQHPAEPENQSVLPKPEKYQTRTTKQRPDSAKPEVTTPVPADPMKKLDSTKLESMTLAQLIMVDSARNSNSTKPEATKLTLAGSTR